MNENTGETKRTANIKVTSTTATYTITVNQYAKGEVIVEGDIKVTPTGGKASEHQEGQDIENTYDGKFSTDGAAPFHTPWGQSAKFPVTLEYYFKGDTEIDYLIYYTRSGNGNFGKVKVYQQPILTDQIIHYRENMTLKSRMLLPKFHFQKA